MLIAYHVISSSRSLVVTCADCAKKFVQAEAFLVTDYLPQDCLALELLAWRQRQLLGGGCAADFDWLLDLAGGVSWQLLQECWLYPSQNIHLQLEPTKLQHLWQQHLAEQVPLQYLVGICPWRDFLLEVNSDVLIPRQETELLIDLALGCIEEHSNTSGRWADLGTGSGALAVALAQALSVWSGHATDCSLLALRTAALNLKRLVPDRCWSLHLGNWWNAVRPWWGQFDLVVCNPPYIPEALIAGLDPMIKDYEPKFALAGGPDGLQSIRILVKQAILALAPRGWLLLEHHHDQSKEVFELMHAGGLVEVQTATDLQGTQRFAIGRRPLKTLTRKVESHG